MAVSKEEFDAGIANVQAVLEGVRAAAKLDLKTQKYASSGRSALMAACQKAYDEVWDEAQGRN